MLGFSDLTIKILQDLYGTYQMENTEVEHEPSRETVEVGFIGRGEQKMATCHWRRNPDKSLSAYFELEPKACVLCVDVTIRQANNEPHVIEIYYAGYFDQALKLEISNLEQWMLVANNVLGLCVDHCLRDLHVENLCDLRLVY